MGTTVFGSAKANVSLGDVALVSAKYVNCWSEKAKANGLLVLLIVRLAGTPEVGVFGVVLVAYVADTFRMIQSNVDDELASVLGFEESKTVYG
jgi:hypothetical protein